MGEAADGLAGTASTFLIWSLWHVECLSRAGDLQEARFLFGKMVGYASHLGPYFEDLGPSGGHLSEVVQAFTHLALISAAYDLERGSLVQGGLHEESRWRPASS